jgi:GPI mannosyltransferase 3
MSAGRKVLLAMCAIVGIAFLLRIILWSALPNQIWPDEIFQSVEQAHRAVFGYGVVPWEFREGTRSWMLPGTLAGVMAATSLLTSSVMAYLTACAAVLSAIAVTPVWATFRAAFAAFGMRGAVVAAFVSTTWFELVYFAPKALNEVVAGNCLVVGALLVESIVRLRRGGEDPRARSVIAATALLTLAAMLRIQLAVSAFAAFAFLIWPLPMRLRWRAIITGAVVVLAAGMLDAITWNYPFQSFVENVRINILVGRSAAYGTAPWYAYFEVYGRIWGIWTIMILALAVVGARGRMILAVCALGVLATHVPIAHKEYRFAYPAMALVMTLAGLGSAQVVTWIHTRYSSRLASLAAVGLCVLWLAASLQGAVGFHESKTRLAKTFGPPQWHWVLHRGSMNALRELGDDPSVCGIGMIGINVFSTGGYAYLHRPDVPLYETITKDQIGGIARMVNVYLVASRLQETEEFMGFTRQSCEADTCIYRRPGTCEVIPDYSFNKVLIGRGH